MDTSLSIRKENTTTTIDFIDSSNEKIGQLEYEIINNRAMIQNTFIYPEYRNKGILKTYFPVILSMISQHNVHSITLSAYDNVAKMVWSRLGFIEDRPNFFTMNINHQNL